MAEAGSAKRTNGNDREAMVFAAKWDFSDKLQLGNLQSHHQLVSEWLDGIRRKLRV
jgi:hypothetical protein